MDLIDLDRRALAAATAAVSAVTPGDLARPTPCAGWDLRTLLTHMTAHNHGFAAAAHGSPVGAQVWDDLTPVDDPVTAFTASADAVNAAFATDGLLERQMDIHGYGVFRAPVAVGMHVVDNLVHSWDVAAAIGTDGGLDPELSEAALRIARRWPTDRPSKAFGVMVPAAEDAPAGDRLLAYLGRDPSWTPPV